MTLQGLISHEPLFLCEKLAKTLSKSYHPCYDGVMKEQQERMRSEMQRLNRELVLAEHRVSTIAAERAELMETMHASGMKLPAIARAAGLAHSTSVSRILAKHRKQQGVQ